MSKQLIVKIEHPMILLDVIIPEEYLWDYVRAVSSVHSVTKQPDSIVTLENGSTRVSVKIFNDREQEFLDHTRRFCELKGFDFEDPRHKGRDRG